MPRPTSALALRNLEARRESEARYIRRACQIVHQMFHATGEGARPGEIVHQMFD
jgi:hypothetical protein